jgi:cytochrome P450
VDQTGSPDVAAAFAHYEPYGIVPEGWRDQLRLVRESCPVVHSDACGGFWLVSRHRDVAKILQTPAVFSSTDGITIPHNPNAPVMPPIDLDPPLQAEFRHLLNPFFTARAVQPCAPVIAALTRQLVDRFAAQGRCELTSAFARPLPALVLGRLILGIEDRGALSDLQSRVAVISGQNTSEEAATAWRFLHRYVTAIAAAARSRPADGGLVSALVHGRVADRPVTEQEQVGTLMILVLGGLGTTADAISDIVVRLTDDPALEDRLRDPGWASLDLAELFRHESPVQWVGRTVTSPVELSGVRLVPGDRVMAHIGSANHDEAVFSRGGALDFTRSQARNLCYGLGPHYCIGAPLAKLMIQIAFAELLDRVTHLRLDPSVPLNRRDGLSRPYRELPITFDLVRLIEPPETPEQSSRRREVVSLLAAIGMTCRRFCRLAGCGSSVNLQGRPLRSDGGGTRAKPGR